MAQVSSTYQDAQASLAKALALIEDASAAGAKIVCLGETFLPGYPAWLDYCMGAPLWNYLPVKEVFAELRANSVVVPGIETTALAEAAGRFHIGIVIGINERVQDGPGHGTLYNSLLFLMKTDV